MICDEAHRTTGVTAFDEEDSHFTLVHDENELNAVKRLYMTATPKYYAQSAKKKPKTMKPKSIPWMMKPNMALNFID